MVNPGPTMRPIGARQESKSRSNQAFQAKGPSAAADQYTPSRTWLKAAAVGIIVASALSAWTTFGGTYNKDADVLGPDHVDADERDRRFDAYLHSAPLVMSEIPRDQQLQAISTMGLSAEQQRRLVADLSEPGMPTPTSQVPAVSDRDHIHLVWLTLWDTDNEDGDAVSINSGTGYTRTVNLTKQPLTMAIPVASGIPIKLKGVRDGEGGGITVGIASGYARPVLPIMSMGQVLTLKVALP